MDLVQVSHGQASCVTLTFQFLNPSSEPSSSCFISLILVQGLDDALVLLHLALMNMSTDCTTLSSAVDSPAAGAATSPPQVHVVSALDPEVILDVVFPTSACRQSRRLITCVRVWYRRYGICAHLTERIGVDVACPDKLDNGMQHQYPERPLQANSVQLFSPEIRDELSVQGKWLGSCESQTGD